MYPELPDYRHFYSNPIAKPPCRMLNAQMYGFFVEGEKAKIQAYIDSTLNTVPSSDFTFKALTNWCLLTFTDIENIASKVAPFSDYGYMQETDIIIWLPILKVSLETRKAEHLYWYPAFIAVNNINALINGREIWGYNKYLCRYRMPEQFGKPLHFSLSLDTFKTFNPSTKMDWHDLLSIYPEDDGESWLKEVLEVGDEIATLFKASVCDLDVDSQFLKQFLSGFTHPQMDQILFKQIPDGYGEKAVYSAVVHSPSEVKKIHKIGFIKDDLHLDLQHLDSFPLNKMFGIPLGKSELKLPYYVKMDFDQAGVEEIVSTTSGITTQRR
ncbi:acetoacetate decarboxylase [Pseudoalteromonas sp. McH1-7]|uniref:acetoacetate decarboxylase n=1 Tax=Pseudoalteromonas TaxID=53246 RepID=UPI000F65579A|nr:MULTISPECIES: acetoacetate decarboxylase [Pseudoalteromonas]MDW7548304.1 acetoacetate decarboxylase [Pseudoalteromonas peptidolytica]NUZ10407.1 acetoacetate decarboxylase [Pseudoalteromonas sp. McH1-7]RRS08270.1 acetoacetate decarboxylase [Pseudoalteromonas sp. J010]RXF01793.1 acetoacetate decarboxylase [Pseudoalteromonas sp. PS5]USD27146.1 acetoacetate decarboxylase [Pseudoalteromonas sp. SCSIO 43201]